MNHSLYASLILIPATALAQDEEHAIVRADVVSNEVVEARPGDEGVPRFDVRLPEDLSKYRPRELPPAVSNFAERHDRAEEFVSYDMRTGREQSTRMEFDPFRTEGWLAGRDLSEEVDEGGFDADFGSFSKQTSTAFPWSAQCKIFFDQDDNGDGDIDDDEHFACSGTLIDAKSLMTAGHCVHAGSGGAWSTNVVVNPRWDGDANAYGSANGIALAAAASWKTSSNWNDDMGWIRLDRPVGFLTNWLGSFYNSNTSFWENTTFHLAGYPGKVSSTFPDAPDALYYTFGSWNSVYTYQVVTVVPSTDTMAGMSGSCPYYKDSDGKRWVGATMSHENWVAWWMDRTATRNTQGKFDYYYNNFRTNGYSSTQVDYVPLKVRTSSTTIARGSAFGSMTYLVANSSLYNPGSATVNVDVFISTNNNISDVDTRIQQHSFTQNFGPRTTRTVTVSGVTVPANTSIGTKYIGVIVTSADADTGNNDTDGWDAQKITVTN